MPSLTETAAQSLPAFAEVAENVRCYHTDGLDQLWRVLQLLSGSLRNRFGARDFDDRLHDLFIALVHTIRAGKLRDPAAVASFIHGVANRTHWAELRASVCHERRLNDLRLWLELRRVRTQEAVIIENERLQCLQARLDTLNARDREILTRFYVHEQTRQQICREMGLDETQFRLFKSRAKARIQGWE